MKAQIDLARLATFQEALDTLAEELGYTIDSLEVRDERTIDVVRISVYITQSYKSYPPGENPHEQMAHLSRKMEEKAQQQL